MANDETEDLYALAFTEWWNEWAATFREQMPPEAEASFFQCLTDPIARVTAVDSGVVVSASDAAAAYNPCVLDADGQCTRWSHDHLSDPPVPVPVSDSPAETECERPCGSIRCETYGCQWWMPSERYLPVEIVRESLSTCTDCGALTQDRKRHDQWHHDLADSVAAVVVDAVVQAAHHA